MTDLRMPEVIYTRTGSNVVFNQLAVKIAMDDVTNEQYFDWLDQMKANIGRRISGAKIAEKPGARTSPPLNTAVYYDTVDYRILSTGALLRTSCRRDTHAFCAFKQAEDDHGVREDHRYVFQGDEKTIIQTAPTSPEAVTIVMKLLSRSDFRHPGTYLLEHYDIDPRTLSPSICLDDRRSHFFVWLDEQDALRCSIDRAVVWNLRLPDYERKKLPVSEVELAVYPRIQEKVARDPRVVDLMHLLRESLCREFGVQITSDIKYQRAAKVLEIRGRQPYIRKEVT
jgi:hypothetical protein